MIRAFAFLCALLLTLTAVHAQSTRATMNSYNNTYIIQNARGAISGPIANTLFGEIISSAGVLDDSNIWTGANTFVIPPTFPFTGLLYGNGANVPASALTLGSGVLLGLQTGVNEPSGFLAYSTSAVGTGLVYSNGAGAGATDVALGTGVLPALSNAVNTPGGFATFSGSSAVTNAVLSSFPSTSGTQIRVGVNTPGDSDPRLFAASGTPCSLNSGAGDGGSQVPINNPTTHSGCWNAFLPNEPDMAGWNPNCDGTNTDPSGARTAATVAAITWANSVGSNLKMPPKPCYAVNGVTLLGISLRGVVFNPQQDTDLYQGSGFRCGLTGACVTIAKPTSGSTGHSGQAMLDKIAIYRDQGTITDPTADCLNIQAWWWSLDHVYCNGHYNGLHDIGSGSISGLIGSINDYSDCNIAGYHWLQDGAAEIKGVNVRLGCNSNVTSASAVTAPLRINQSLGYVGITGVSGSSGPASIFLTNFTLNDTSPGSACGLGSGFCLNPLCAFCWFNVGQQYPNAIEWIFTNFHYEITGQAGPTAGTPAAVFKSDGSLQIINQFDFVGFHVDDFTGTDRIFNFTGGSPSTVSSWSITGGDVIGFENAVTAGSFSIGNTYTIATVGSTDFTAIGAASNTVGVNFKATGIGSGSGTARDTCDWGTGQTIFGLHITGVTFENCKVIVDLPSTSDATFEGVSYGNGLSFNGTPTAAHFSGVMHSGGVDSSGITNPQSVNLDIPGYDMSSSFTPVVTCTGASLPITSGYTATGSYVRKGFDTFYRANISIVSAPPTLTAGSFVVGNKYVIVSIGSTDFTLIGAASNTVGLGFTATGVGSGSGTATNVCSPIVVTTPTTPAFIQPVPGSNAANAGTAWQARTSSGSATMAISQASSNSTVLNTGDALTFAGHYQNQ